MAFNNVIKVGLEVVKWRGEGNKKEGTKKEFKWERDILWAKGS